MANQNVVGTCRALSLSYNFSVAVTDLRWQGKDRRVRLFRNTIKSSQGFWCKGFVSYQLAIWS